MRDSGIYLLLRNALLICVLFVLCLKISAVYRLSQEYHKVTDKYEYQELFIWPDIITGFLLQQPCKLRDLLTYDLSSNHTIFKFLFA